MGIDEFDPISQPKRLKSAAKLRELPDGEKLILEAADTKRRAEEITEK